MYKSPNKNALSNVSNEEEIFNEQNSLIKMSIL